MGNLVLKSPSIDHLKGIGNAIGKGEIFAMVIPLISPKTSSISKSDFEKWIDPFKRVNAGLNVPSTSNVIEDEER